MGMSDLLREFGTEAAGQADATGQLLKGLALQPVAGLGGAGRTIVDLLRGQGLEKSLEAGAKQVEDISGWGGGPITERGAQRLQGAGDIVKGATEKVGAALGNPIDRLGAVSPAAGALTAGLVEVADPTKVVGKVSRAGKTAAKAAKAVPEAPPLPEGMLPRNAQTLAPLYAAGEGDIAKSIKSDEKYKAGVPAETIPTALRNRAELRAEPPVLPKPAGEMSDVEWQQFGQQHGVDLTRSPRQSIWGDIATKRNLEVPGGLEGKFTIPDLFDIKANNFDPNMLPKEVHDQLMQKFIRTYDRPGGMDPTDQYNALNFALLSPNAPLTQNEFLAMRLRARGPEDLQKIAEMSPEQARAAEGGTGAASRGGMGVKGTADYGNQPRLAQLLRNAPDMFKRGEGEGLTDVARRVMNQVPGLGPKTASLGVPWLDLPRADTSAVDLHMIRNNMARLMGDPELGPAFTEHLGKKTGVPNATADDLLRMRREDPAFDKKLEKAAIDVVSSHPSPKYRLKGGEVNPSVHKAVQPERLFDEPKSATEFGPYYNKIVDYVNQSRGENPELALFPEQWRLWDRYRGRVEPHEMAHPDIRKLPKMSWEEMQSALGEHKEKGYTSTYKDPVTGEVHTQRLKEDYPTDWKKMAYFTAPAMGAAGAMSSLLRGEEDKKRKEAD